MSSANPDLGIQPEGDARCPVRPEHPAPPIELLLALVSGYPGPAILLDLEDGIQAASERALWLLGDLAEASWWHGLVGWFLASDPPSPPQHSTTIDSPQGRVIIEWQTTRVAETLVILLGRDVTAERNLRGALAESRQRFRDLVELAADFAWETDASGSFVYVSPPGALGFPADQLVGTRADRLLAVDDEVVASPFTADRPTAETELWLRRADGSIASVVAWARPILDDGENHQGVRGLCRDVTDDRQRDQALSGARNRERMTAHIMHAMTGHREPVDGLRAALAALMHAVGASGALVQPRHPLAGDAAARPIVPKDDAASRIAAAQVVAQATQQQDLFAAAQPVLVDTEAGPVMAKATCYGNAANGTLLVWRDRARRAWEQEDADLVAMLADQFGITLTAAALFQRLRHQAERDALTGLYNRGAMMERLTQRLAGERPPGPVSTLLYIDLDNFKAVNDICGHHQGDAVLGALSRLLRDAGGPDDLAGRVGGDEFLLWLEGRDGQQGRTVAQHLIDQVRSIAETMSAAPDKPLGLSIGIAATGPTGTTDVGALIGRSDAAMYRAKQRGKASGAGGYWHIDAGPTG